MNKHTRKQLDKVKRFSLGYYDDNTTHIFIPKITSIKIDVDCCYLVKLSDSIVHPQPNSTLATNWNQGRVPTHYYYKVDICKILGTMIQVNGVAYDYENQKDINELWSGWLPLKDIEVLCKL